MWRGWVLPTSWVNGFGIALQVAGVVLGAVLLMRLAETVGRRAPPLEWFRKARAWLARIGAWLCRSDRAVIVHPLTATGTAEAAGALRLAKTRGAMPAGLTVEEQLAWVLEFVRDVEQRHNQLAAEVGDVSSALSDEIDRVRSQARQLMEAAVEQARADFKRDVGKDLWLEVLSLGMIGAGVILAAV
jgi:hypothetical protein